MYSSIQMNQKLWHSKEPSWKYFYNEPHLEVLENLNPIFHFTTRLININNLTNYIIQLLPFNYHKFNELPIKAEKW